MHTINRRFTAKLDADITDVATSAVLNTIGAVDAVTVPFYARIGSELIEITAYTADSPTAGHAAITIARAQKGTSAAAHTLGMDVAQVVAGWEINEINTRLFATERAFTGNKSADGVMRETAVSTALKVVAQSSPGATVQVSPGAGIVSGQPVQILTATNTAAFIAPVGNFRIDIVQIGQDCTVSIKQGTLGGAAPAVDALNMKLCEVYLRAGNAVIKNTDDSTNGYITDKREFA